MGLQALKLYSTTSSTTTLRWCLALRTMTSAQASRTPPLTTGPSCGLRQTQRKPPTLCAGHTTTASWARKLLLKPQMIAKIEIYKVFIGKKKKKKSFFGKKKKKKKKKKS